MTQLSAFLKLEVSKYKDIDHILRKLEDDGEIQNIYEVFKTIFDGEFKFTFQELLRIQEAKKEPLNIKRQCENNLLLFKNNLMLIVDMIIEKALRSTLSENKSKYEEGPEATLAYTEEEPTGFPPTSASTISPIPKKSNNRKSRSKEKIVPSKDQLLNLSVETKNSYADKRSNFSHLSTSKIDSPLTQLLNNSSTPTRSKEHPTHSREKSASELNQRVGTLSAQPSRASLHQDVQYTVNNSSPSFVQSEFNHVRGSVKFSRSPRNRDQVDLSPGPGSYPTKSSLRQSPSPKIGKAPKVCWFDKIARNDSPGPHLYPSMHFCSK